MGPIDPSHKNPFPIDPSQNKPFSNEHVQKGDQAANANKPVQQNPVQQSPVQNPQDQTQGVHHREGGHKGGEAQVVQGIQTRQKSWKGRFAHMQNPLVNINQKFLKAETKRVSKEGKKIKEDNRKSSDDKKKKSSDDEEDHQKQKDELEFGDDRSQGPRNFI
jgi:hypothetical protein